MPYLEELVGGRILPVDQSAAAGAPSSAADPLDELPEDVLDVLIFDLLNRR